MIEFPNKKYQVILADPPWNFTLYSEKGNKKSASRHYDCMNIEDIKALPVGNLADENCVLFLWTTKAFIEITFDVLDAWGFKYKTMGFTWVKLNKKSQGYFMNTGYWTRGNPEFCLLATKGHPKRKDGGVRELTITTDDDDTVIDRLREHSRKPDAIHSKIEQLVDGPYIELFARQKHPGWDVWGNETDKFNEYNKQGLDKFL